MEKLKIFFTFNNKLFAINSDNKYIQLENGFQIYANEDNLPSLKSGNFIMLEKNWLIVFDETNLSVYNIHKTFIKCYYQKYDVGINVYDTYTINGFICLYLNDNSSQIISLETFTSHEFLEPKFIANTNGKSIIELDIHQKNSLFYRVANYQDKFIFNDFYLDPVVHKPKQISIEKILIHQDLNHYILQSNYDYIYLISIENKICPIAKIVIKNTFLGDTVCVNNVWYHISNQNIYKIDWEKNQAQLVINWTGLMDYTDYSGIVVLQVYQDMIVFLGTVRGTLVFYSCELNKVIDYTILNRTFYINTKSIIFQNKLWLIDSEQILQNYPIPI